MQVFFAWRSEVDAKAREEKELAAFFEASDQRKGGGARGAKGAAAGDGDDFPTERLAAKLGEIGVIDYTAKKKYKTGPKAQNGEEYTEQKLAEWRASRYVRSTNEYDEL